MKTPRLTRRSLLAVSSMGAAALTAPGVVRAQTRDLVVGGAAGMAGYMKEFVFPVIEKKHGMRIVFDGTRSLVNLEKMRADRAAPKMSVVLMDDPIMLLAEAEGLLTKLTPTATPNLAKIKPEAVHMDGAWANYQQPWAGIAYNTKATPAGVPSYEALWSPANKDKVVLPSLQNTEGLWTLLVAAHLETGKPYAQAQYEMEAGFKRLAALAGGLSNVQVGADLKLFRGLHNPASTAVVILWAGLAVAIMALLAWWTVAGVQLNANLVAAIPWWAWLGGALQGLTASLLPRSPKRFWLVTIR